MADKSIFFIKLSQLEKDRVTEKSQLALPDIKKMGQYREKADEYTPTVSRWQYPNEEQMDSR